MADNFGLKIGVEGEKEFKKALSDINQSFKVLGSEMKLVESEFGKNENSVQSLTAKNEVLTKQIDAQKDKIETLRKALQNASDSFGENDRRTQQWVVQLNNAQAELNRLQAPLSLAQIEHELSTLVISSALPGAFYRLSPAKPDTLVAEVEQRSGSQLFIRPALEFAVANGEPTRGSLRGFVTYLPKGAFQAPYRVQFSIGYSPMLAAEYERPFSGTPWFWSPSLHIQRQNSSTYNGTENLTHWQDTYSGSLDLGYGRGQRLRLRAGIEAGYEKVSSQQLLGALPVSNGAFVAPRFKADWNTLDNASLPTHGTLFTASVAGRYRSSESGTVPLAQASLAHHFPALSGTITASLNAGSSFGVPVNYFDLFPLGGPADLRAFRYQQFHASSYAYGALAYRKPFGHFKLFGQRPQFGAWYDVAGLTQPLQSWQSVQSGSVGVLLNSPLGVITLGIGRTNDDQTRAWINIGRP